VLVDGMFVLPYVQERYKIAYNFYNVKAKLKYMLPGLNKIEYGV